MATGIDSDDQYEPLDIVEALPPFADMVIPPSSEWPRPLEMLPLLMQMVEPTTAAPSDHDLVAVEGRESQEWPLWMYALHMQAEQEIAERGPFTSLSTQDPCNRYGQDLANSLVRSTHDSRPRRRDCSRQTRRPALTVQDAIDHTDVRRRHTPVVLRPYTAALLVPSSNLPSLHDRPVPPSIIRAIHANARGEDNIEPPPTRLPSPDIVLPKDCPTIPKRWSMCLRKPKAWYFAARFDSQREVRIQLERSDIVIKLVNVTTSHNEKLLQLTIDILHRVHGVGLKKHYDSLLNRVAGSGLFYIEKGAAKSACSYKKFIYALEYSMQHGGQITGSDTVQLTLWVVKGRDHLNHLLSIMPRVGRDLRKYEVDTCIRFYCKSEKRFLMTVRPRLFR